MNMKMSVQCYRRWWLLAIKECQVPASFALTKDLGIYNAPDDLSFWVQEMKRVYDYWKS